MARVIWSVMSTLDGYSAAEGAGFETIAWFRADQEWLDYSVELLDEASTLLFGGITFAGTEQYWPTAEGPVAERMNALPGRDGKGVAVLMGSANLAGTLIDSGSSTSTASP